MTDQDPNQTDRASVNTDPSMQDGLTGLMNRKGMEEKIKATAARMTPLGGEMREGDIRHLTFLFLCLDKFNAIQEKHGAAGAEQVLKAFADHLRKTFPRSGDIIARTGEDEFEIVFVGAPVENIWDTKFIAKRDEHGNFVYRIPEVPPLTIKTDKGEETITLTASGGITGYMTGESMEEAQKRAEEAAYFSKLNGHDHIENAKDLPRHHHETAGKEQ